MHCLLFSLWISHFIQKTVLSLSCYWNLKCSGSCILWLVTFSFMYLSHSKCKSVGQKKKMIICLNYLSFRFQQINARKNWPRCSLCDQIFKSPRKYVHHLSSAQHKEVGWLERCMGLLLFQITMALL